MDLGAQRAVDFREVETGIETAVILLRNWLQNWWGHSWSQGGGQVHILERKKYEISYIVAVTLVTVSYKTSHRTACLLRNMYMKHAPVTSNGRCSVRIQPPLAAILVSIE